MNAEVEPPVFEKPLFVFSLLLYDRLSSVPIGPKSQLLKTMYSRRGCHGRKNTLSSHRSLSCTTLYVYAACVASPCHQFCLVSPTETSASPNNSIHNLIFHRSFACSFLLIAALLSHVLVVSLMAFAEVSADVVVKTLRANF